MVRCRWVYGVLGLLVASVVLSGCKSQTIQGDGPKVITAKELYYQVCQYGIVMHCLDTGVKPNKDTAVNQDAKKRVAEVHKQLVAQYKRQCDDGPSKALFAQGCSYLGMMYKYGNGVDQDYNKANSLFKMACDHKGPGGCHNLGIMHEDGLGIVQNSEKAAAIFKKNCAGGFEPSCTFNLAVLYQRGIGTKRNDKKAEEFLQKACDEGDALSCKALTKMKP